MLFLSRCKGDVFEDGDLIVDLHRRTVQIDKNDLRLTEAEYNLLRVLVLDNARQAFDTVPADPRSVGEEL